MTEKQCSCGNPAYGFECVCAWVDRNPGTVEYTCEFCGIYKAASPRCSKCYADERVVNETYWTLFWFDGKREVLVGPTISEAFSKAGYGAGAMAALDFYTPGDSDEHEFVEGKWRSKQPCQG